MSVYYRGPCARITHVTFEVWCPFHRVFAVRDLRQVCVVEVHRGSMTPVTAGSSGLAGVAVVVVATEGLDVASPLALMGGIALLFAAALAVVGTCLRVRPGLYELRAVYRGVPVSLYATPDRQEFGQVRRALRRALEHRDDRR